MLFIKKVLNIVYNNAFYNKFAVKERYDENRRKEKIEKIKKETMKWMRKKIILQ